MTNTLREAVCREVLAVLHKQGIRYCLLNGTGEFPQSNNEDLDVLIGRETPLAILARLLQENEQQIGAKLVAGNGTFCVLLCTGASAPPQFLLLDFLYENPTSTAVHFPAEHVLTTSHEVNGVHVASTGIAFAVSLSKAASRGVVDSDRRTRIQALLMRDKAACAAAATRIWGAARASDVVTTVADARWPDLESLLSSLKSPAPTSSWLTRLRSKVKKFVHPPGFHIVMLGPDGAGKSSVVDMLEATMTGPFSSVLVLGFAPPLYKLWRRGPTSTSTPHAKKPRSYAVSVLRAAFWFAYNILGHATLRIAKARNVLIVNDRHFIDILVDPVRYRYAGPRWLLQLIRKTMPRPDATVLLYGPPEILQARKKELSIEETARQCRDYLTLVSQLHGGQVVDAAQPFDGVMRDVLAIIFHRA
jgi:thymidylate kinase